MEGKRSYYVLRTVGDHLFSTYTKFLEKLTNLNPRYAHLRVCFRRQEILAFWNIRTY